MSIYDKHRIERFSQKGLCLRCGIRPPEEGKKWCQQCTDYYLNYRKKYMGRPGKKERHYETSLAWQRRNPEKVAILAKRARRKLREIVFKHYGSKCACCGESQIEFLTMDHIKGGGNKIRKESPKMRQSYSWIKMSNYPNDLQILCHNCNAAKAHYGVCPHKKQGQNDHS